MKEVLAEVLVLLVLFVVPIFIAKVFAWWKARADVAVDKEYMNAVEALETGVHEAWERFGKEWKGARADGKLSQDERERLRTVAKEVAVEVGKEEGLDVLKIIGVRKIPLLIRKIVASRKGKSV